MMMRGSWMLAVGLALSGSGMLQAVQVPEVIHYQGRVLVDGVGFDGTGEFKFGLVEGETDVVVWGNAPDADGDGEPDGAVSVAVTRGHYSVYLGDTNLVNMAPLPVEALASGRVHLRTWFNDGTHGFGRLQPDHRLAAVGYAMVAAEIPDGVVTASKLAAGAVTAEVVTGRLRREQLPEGVAYRESEVDPLIQRVVALELALASTQAQLNALESQGTNQVRGRVVVSDQLEEVVLLEAGYQPFASIPSPGWRNGAEGNAPAGRESPASVWTGSEWVIWGGELGPDLFSGMGALYRAEADAWVTLEASAALSARVGAEALWTGDEVLVWGGYGAAGFLDTGAKLSLADRIWTALAPATEVGGRMGHGMVWTGKVMVVWGGRNETGPLSSGAVYDLAGGQWRSLDLPGSPVARHAASALRAGSRWIVWGGIGEAGVRGDGGQLLWDPAGSPSEWRLVTNEGAPEGREGHTAIWTGTRMIVWGGRRENGSLLGGGGEYDPATDRWTALPMAGAPEARAEHGAVWTGQEMVVVGGITALGETATGGAYDPVTRRWRPLTLEGGPLARTRPAVAWTGRELMIFGGRSGGGAVARLQRLQPEPAWHFYRKP